MARRQNGRRRSKDPGPGNGVFFYGISRCLFMGIEWEFHGYLMCVGEKNLEIMWNDIDISTNTIGII